MTVPRRRFFAGYAPPHCNPPVPDDFLRFDFDLAKRCLLTLAAGCPPRLLDELRRPKHGLLR